MMKMIFRIKYLLFAKQAKSTKLNPKIPFLASTSSLEFFFFFSFNWIQTNLTESSAITASSSLIGRYDFLSIFPFDHIYK